MSEKFENWSGSLQFTPEKIMYPQSDDEIIRIVRRAVQAGKTVRMIGSGHSWTPLVKTDSILLSLQKYQGIISIDKESNIAEVKAGTSIKRLGELLYEQGYAMENLGDIDVQSLAGALSTGTHGTGVNYGTLSTQLEGITFINGLGEVITCSREVKPELFRAAQVSLGALGVIVRMKIRVIPTFRLKLHTKGASLEETLDRLEDYKREYQHFEFYWMPGTKKVYLKMANPSTDEFRGIGISKVLQEIFLENILLGSLMWIARFIPAFSRMVSKIIAASTSENIVVDHSHRIFATVRWIKFNEMEYNIPKEHFKTVIYEMEAAFEKEKYQVPFPIECRWVKKDNIMISPASGRDSAYIAIHQFKGMKYEKYFNDMEKIFRKYNGRPHYGKMNSANLANFAKFYPEWEAFQAIRQKQDPQGVFLNPYLKGIFGAKMPEKHQHI